MTQVFVGVDVGTSAVKVLASDVEGRIMGQGAESYPLITPQPGFVEQDADTVYVATMHVLAQVLDDVRLRGNEIAAIGISTAMHSVLPIDERGEPAGHLITWMDRRSADVADRWHADGTAMRLYRETGAPMHPMLPVCKLRWMAEHDPATFKSARRFVGMKEFLIARWTGEWLVDAGIASATGLFDIRTRTWSDDALAAAGIDPSRLSLLAPTSRVVRDFRPAVAKVLRLPENAPVVLASSDGALANLGVGAVRPSDVALTLGTSGAVRTVLDEPVFDEHARTFAYAFDDTHALIGGPTSSAGAVVNWLLALLIDELPPERRFAEAIRFAESVPAGEGGLTVMPFLSGERAPYWQSSLRGGMLGLDLAHDRRHLIRATFEGVVFAVHAVYDVIRERVGTPERIVLSGGLTHAPFIRQLVADVFGVTAAQPSQPEASAFGAAMMAALGVGALRSLGDVAARSTVIEERQPDPQAQERYREIVARYTERVGATNKLYA